MTTRLRTQAALDVYMPRPEWFARPDIRGIHGIGHIGRVVVWSSVIATRLEASINHDVLLWAAGLHDVRRLDDGIDPGHGVRAAFWATTVFPCLCPDVAATLDLAFVANLCRWHDVTDRQVTHWPDELRVLKDADALDRARLGDLDPDRLRLPVSHELIAPAQVLWRQSVECGDDAGAVRAVAQASGWWS